MNKLLSTVFYLFLLCTIPASGALNLQLKSVLDIKRQGGTAVGSFDDTIGDPGPSFQLGVSNKTTFHIRNNGSGAAGDWEWRTTGILETSTTVEISVAEIWSTGVVPIDDSLLVSNADRFAPDSVAYLIGRWNDDYYAFRFGLWDDRARLRLYGVEAADVTITTGFIPESGSFALIAGLLAAGAMITRRSAHKSV